MQHLLDVWHRLTERVPGPTPEDEPEPSTDWLLLFALTLDERRIADTRERRLPH